MDRRIVSFLSAFVLLFVALFAPQAADASSYGRMQIDANGAQTFSASSDPTDPAASTTDFWQIYGSSTKTISVLRIEVAYKSNSTSRSDRFDLIRRSTANSGGTSTLLTNVPFDSTNASGTAAVRIYTANPSSLGTSVGKVSSGYLTSVTDSGTVYSVPISSTGAQVIYDYRLTGQPEVLRGTDEGLCLNFAGTKPTSNTPKLIVTVYWTEK